MQLGRCLRGSQLEVRQALGFPSRAQLCRRLAIAGLGLLQRLASFARLGAPDFHPELLAQLIELGFLRRWLEFHCGSDGHRGFGLHLLDAGQQGRQRGLRPLGFVTRQRLLGRRQHGFRVRSPGQGSGTVGLASARIGFAHPRRLRWAGLLFRLFRRGHARLAAILSRGIRAGLNAISHASVHPDQPFTKGLGRTGLHGMRRLCANTIDRGFRGHLFLGLTCHLGRCDPWLGGL
ncbi:hypothetical protein D3C75_911990 [compost metagenome]